MTDLRAALMETMVQRNQWSMNYKNIERTVSGFPERIPKADLRDELDRMVKDGIAEYHKNKKCISLRSARSKDVKEYIEKHGEMAQYKIDHFFS